MKTAILYLSEAGRELARKIQARLPDSTMHQCRGGSLKSTTRKAWDDADALVFIMATGIAVRVISPLVQDKYRDPAVVVCDERGRYAISLLSGHIGGANRLAEIIANITGGQAVITTASDIYGYTAVDLWARNLGIVFDDRTALTRVMARLLEKGSLKIWSECALPQLPEDFRQVNHISDADIILGFRTRDHLPGVPSRAALGTLPVLCAGIGCNRRTGASAIKKALSETCLQHGLAMSSIDRIASIDIKQDEQGLIDFARTSGRRLLFFTKDELNAVNNVATSSVVFRATGAKGVAEPAAILGAGNGKLIVRKMKWKDVTTAIALDTSSWWEQGPAQKT